MLGLRRALFGLPLELRSPFMPSECIDLLRQNTDPAWNLFGSKPVVGTVRNQKFTGYKRIWYGNSFRTFIFSRITPEVGGSRIAIRFGISPFVMVFMTFWWTGLLLIGGAILIQTSVALVKGHTQVVQWMGIVIPILMAAFGVGIFIFGRWLGRNERAFLIEFVRTVLKAT